MAGPNSRAHTGFNPNMLTPIPNVQNNSFWCNPTDEKIYGDNLKKIILSLIALKAPSGNLAGANLLR